MKPLSRVAGETFELMALYLVLCNLRHLKLICGSKMKLFEVVADDQLWII